MPLDLRRLRAECLHRLGLIPQALSEAEILAQEDPKPENLCYLMQLQYQKGDLKGFALTAKRLIENEGVEHSLLLWTVWVLSLDDFDLARDIWRRIVREGVEDTLISEMVTLCYQLGLDQEMVPLIRQMQRLASQGKGSVKLENLTDFVQIHKQWEEHARKVSEAYADGAIPVHLFAHDHKFPLAIAYQGQTKNNYLNPHPLDQPFIFIRHGGRTLSEHGYKIESETHLYLDITALLMAAHLDLLDNLENTFSPLHISGSLIPALTYQLSLLQSHQPSILWAYKKILQLHQAGGIQTATDKIDPGVEMKNLQDKMGAPWVAMFQQAKTQDGYLIDFLPLHTHDVNLIQ